MHIFFFLSGFPRSDLIGHSCKNFLIEGFIYEEKWEQGVKKEKIHLLVVWLLLSFFFFFCRSVIFELTRKDKNISIKKKKIVIEKVPIIYRASQRQRSHWQGSRTETNVLHVAELQRVCTLKFLTHEKHKYKYKKIPTIKRKTVKKKVCFYFVSKKCIYLFIYFILKIYLIFSGCISSDGSVFTRH